MASTNRDKDLARQRAERQAARASAAGQRRQQRNAVLGSVVAVALVGGAVVAAGSLLGGSQDPLAGVFGDPHVQVTAGQHERCGAP